MPMPESSPLILTLIIVIAFARFVGWIFRMLGQPPVMGEVLGGILLGPSALGYAWPQASSFVFHAEAVAFLKHVAELGISIYLFVIGLEIDLSRLKRSARSAVLVSQLSIILPFLLGVGLANQLFDQFAPPGVGLFPFSLFIGVSLSITAFPVLARILNDSPLRKTSLGDLALTCAAIDDVTAWCLVALVIGISANAPQTALITLILTVAYIALMLFLVRPGIKKWISKLEAKFDRLPEALLALAIVGALASATITELIGVHALFGAFLFGAIIPHDSLVAHDINGRLNDFVRILFLPAFFALTGLKTEIGLLTTADHWRTCAIIVFLAIVGKFGGAFLGSAFAGNRPRDSAILGILMNTRGLVELIVLNIGLASGILSPVLFTMLVIMALVTTFMTGPLLRIALRW